MPLAGIHLRNVSITADQGLVCQDAKDITLDGVAGDVQANTVSGTLEGRDVDGAVRFKSVSGDLTLADGSLALLEAGASVTAVEIDPRLAAALPTTVSERAPAEASRLAVIQADALTVTSLDP